MQTEIQSNNKKYNLSCDLFFLDYREGNKILYAPRLRFAFIANPDLQNLMGMVMQDKMHSYNERQIKVLDFLESKGVFNQNKEWINDQPKQKEFKPLSLTLFPTNRCNLRCIYCYASAGEHNPVKIKWIFVKSAIDFVTNNLMSSNSKNFFLGFHGGGEPLFEWDIVTRAVEYARKSCLKNGFELTVASATNGILSKKKLEYIVENFKSLNISFDGNIFSQNHHRPMISGKGSFPLVNKTMNYLDKRDFNYSVRSTISSDTVGQMEEIIKFITRNYKCRFIQLEPVSYTGRCQSNSNLTVDLFQFAERFSHCEEIAKQANVHISYSGCKIDNLSDTFCGVSNDSFAVTPEGYIASCFEVTSVNDPRAEIMFIGKINEKGEIIIDSQKRDYLNSIKINNLDYCKDCFAKWHCAGDCITRLGHNDYLGPRGHDRCRLNREMIRSSIIRIFESEVNNANN